jgi:hypothetical protein
MFRAKSASVDRLVGRMIHLTTCDITRGWMLDDCTADRNVVRESELWERRDKRCTVQRGILDGINMVCHLHDDGSANVQNSIVIDKFGHAKGENVEKASYRG